MTARRGWLAAVALGLLAQAAWAQPRPARADDPKIEDDEIEPPAAPAAPADGDKADGGDKGDGGITPTTRQGARPTAVKQDLTGHDPGTPRPENAFEHDRFFADKTDSEETAKGTLIQGSLTSSTFGYRESGGALTPQILDPTIVPLPVPANSPYSRLYTDLRLQTDLRHISAGQWDARVDVRGRLVNDPGVQTSATYVSVTNSSVQSGLLGRNELEIKELWLVRKGKRSDVFIGRQFVADLGAVRFDGLRVDYAKSEALTLLGFAGLYPIRGSRSITDDYTALLAEPDPVDGTRGSAGRFTATGGVGGAYRTPNTHGSLGGVVIAPLAGEDPRIYVTSNGYWRFGSKLDVYHLAIFDVVGSNAVNTGLTNLSLGLNWKPDTRLRGTLAFHRVDTETLNVQAQAFLQDPDRDFDVIQNEAYIQRIATNQARASLSAGLGELQRIELTAAVAFRYRGDVTFTTPLAVEPTTTVLPAASSLEVYGSILDRRSIANLRLGLDGSRTLGIGDNTYQRTSSTQVRVFLGHAIGSRGEWELEAAYHSNEDDGAGTMCAGDLLTCLGASKSTVLSGGGNLSVRMTRNWMMMASAFANRITITRVDSDTVSFKDPAVLGLSGFFRIAYRF
jgi:hypothetical protein